MAGRSTRGRERNLNPLAADVARAMAHDIRVHARLDDGTDVIDHVAALPITRRNVGRPSNSRSNLTVVFAGGREVDLERIVRFTRAD